MRNSLAAVGAAVFTCALVASPFWGAARAQSFSPTINPNSPPIVVLQAPEKLAVRPKIADQKLLSIAFGATANGGNTKSYAGNLGGRFGLLRSNHQLMIEALASLGYARQGKLTDVDPTSRNILARARYDLFLSQLDSVFVAIAPRHDPFAGLDVRLQNQIGYARSLYYPSDAHRLWTEVGYDLTYDNTRALQGAAKPPTQTPPTMPVDMGTKSKKSSKQCVKTEDTCVVHSARLFLGYTNRLSATANLTLGIENLFDFVEPSNFRVNGLIELTSSITQSFKLGVQSRFLYDRVPVNEQATELDVIAVAQLVYTFDSLAGKAQNVCPVCDCSAQVQAARAACGTTEPLRTIR